AKFEQLCKGWFEKAIAPIAQVLEDAKMNKDDVHEIVLVGGSTRIPKMRSMIFHELVADDQL
ncbi:MAG: Hsp70 family protein, partial [SAR324 cluster bacterium]|nr:Hsp70 family protein [SAR324 cluster bacterium]